MNKENSGEKPLLLIFKNSKDKRLYVRTYPKVTKKELMQLAEYWDSVFFKFLKQIPGAMMVIDSKKEMIDIIKKKVK